MSVIKDDQTTYTGNVTILGSITAGSITAPLASSTVFGVVKVDGTTIIASSGIISTVNPLPAPIHASLGADVALNNTANYFDGPSIAQGATGTWWVSGQVSVQDTAGSANIEAKLWDGATVIASGHSEIPAASGVAVISLSGFLATPAGNIRISCKDPTSTSGKILFNGSGNSKDSTISAFRIA